MLSSIKPDERPKVIGLLSAVAVVFVVGGINVARQAGVGTSAPAPTVVTPPADASTPSATPAATPAAGVAAGKPSITEADNTLYVSRPLSAADKLALQQPIFGSDPFRPIVTPKTTPGVIPIGGPTGPPAAPIISQVTPMPLLGMSLNSKPVVPSPTPAPEAPLRLTGVVSGADSIAMITVGGGQRFLHKGDMIQGYKVVKIDEDTATLRRGDAGKILRVGTDGIELVQFPKSGPAQAVRVVKAAQTQAIAALPKGVTAWDLLAAVGTSKTVTASTSGLAASVVRPETRGH